MNLDPKAKKAAYDAALPAIELDAAPFHVIDLAITSYLSAQPVADERVKALVECAAIAHRAHLQCVDERDRIRQNTPEFGYAQAKVDAVTSVWHQINDLIPREPSDGSTP